jgi:hypothetical protein
LTPPPRRAYVDAMRLSARRLAGAALVVGLTGGLSAAADEARRAEDAATRAEAAATRSEAAATRAEQAIDRLTRIIDEMGRREETRRGTRPRR